MTRKERVLRALEQVCEKDERGSPQGLLGITAGEVADHLSLLRNNCSADLNELQREGRVIRIKGRPTRYLPKVWIEKRLARGRVLFATEYPSLEVFQRATGLPLAPIVGIDTPTSRLERMIGSQRSLHAAIDQAKMAINYPPYGMHVLLLGETGVGKSTFARTMHAFAVESGYLAADAPFGAFNCSEYANNPEILLDHLFGHVKGAFTGAHRDKPGLVETTHGGVLFLDEVHRLPPEGQEMLFHLLDFGEFRRLGESAEFREARIRLFAATTEAPESALLSTFLRRIPMVIRLPSLRDWSFHDRYELVVQLFSDEAKATGHWFKLTSDALERLLMADFPANIGGLKNAVKLACARAFSHSERVGEVVILKSDVPEPNQQEGQWHQPLAAQLNELFVGPTEEPFAIPFLPLDSLFARLNRLGGSLQDLGFSPAEIVGSIGREAHRRVGSDAAGKTDDDLKRFVGEVFFTWMSRSWRVVEQSMPAEIGRLGFTSVALHLYGVVHAAFAPDEEMRSVFHELVRAELPELSDLADRFLHVFEQESGLRLSRDERTLVALLLRGDVNVSQERVGIVVALLGDGIATSIVDAAMRLAGSGLVTALEVPLQSAQDWIDSHCLEAIRRVDRGKGVLILTDIGLLTNLLGRTQPSSHLPPVRFVFRPDLATVARALYAVNAGVGTLTDIAIWIQSTPARWEERSTVVTERVIWACCLTGRGTAHSIKRLIEQGLPETVRPSVRVEPVEIGGGRSLPDTPGQSPVAIIGSVQPPVFGVPFFAVEEILTPQGIERLLQVVLFGDPAVMQLSQSESATTSDAKLPTPNSLTQHVRQTLERDLIYVNPALVMIAARDMIEYISEKAAKRFSPEWEARFCLHMAYAIERVVKGEMVVYPYLERVKRLFSREWNVLLGLRGVIKHYFGLETEENEIAYLFEMVFPDRTMEMFDL